MSEILINIAKSMIRKKSTVIKERFRCDGRVYIYNLFIEEEKT